MADNSIVLLEVEQTLKDDTDGTARDSLVSAFEQDARQVKTEMDRGLEPDAFAAAEKMKTALEASVHVIKVFHGVQHAKP